MEQTKERIVEAATVEFSAYGIAGARVDRIAARAGCGKGLLYTYFGNKESLFDVVYDRTVTEAVDAVDFSAADLPGYAVSLHDYTDRNPVVVRLKTWNTLERGPQSTAPAADASTRRKFEALADAQKRGEVNAAIPAADLLDVIVAIAMLGPRGSERKESIRQAVRTLTTP